MAFIPPQGNKTVMVDSSNNIVYPATFQKVVATQATIAGNNFTSVPSVIDPENATTTQLPSVASVVSYVSDVVEGGSSGLIPAIQSDIQTLGQVKSNRSELYFNNGTLICRNNKWSTDSEFSYVFTFSMSQDDWTNMAAMYYGHWVNTAAYGGSSNESGVWFGDPGNRLAVRLAYKKSDGTFGAKDIQTSSAQWSPYLDNKPHIICASFSNGIFKLNIDGTEIKSVSVPDFTPSQNSQYFTIRSYGKLSRVAVYNFDMSDENAPYTIADYISGKDASPLLSGALLSLDDYSIKVGATQIVPDVSGNNNDATITGGVVMGSKDNSIAKMAQLFYQSQQG